MESLWTPSRRWSRLGTIDATAAGADVALAVAERDLITNGDLANVVWTDMDKLIAPEAPESPINLAEVRFLLTTNNADVDIDVWAGRWSRGTSVNCELSRVCTLDVICGQQDGDDTTLHFADTINISNNQWLKTVSAIVPGTDHQARLLFDLCGCNILLFHGYGTFDEDCIVEIAGC